MVLYCWCDRQAVEVRRNVNALVTEAPALLSFLTNAKCANCLSPGTADLTTGVSSANAEDQSSRGYHAPLLHHFFIIILLARKKGFFTAYDVMFLFLFL